MIRWRGTAKLSQNKPDAAQAGVAAAFEAAGRRDMVSLMERP